MAWEQVENDNFELNPCNGSTLNPGNGYFLNTVDGTISNTIEGPRSKSYSLYGINHHGIEFPESHGDDQKGKECNVDNQRPYEATRDEFLSDLTPDAWQLGAKDLETISNDYFYTEHGERLKSAAFQSKLKWLHLVFHSIMTGWPSNQLAALKITLVKFL